MCQNLKKLELANTLLKHVRNASGSPGAFRRFLVLVGSQNLILQDLLRSIPSFRCYIFLSES